MFKLFNKKSEVEKLNDKYEVLPKNAHDLSTSNRKLSNAKTAEAAKVLKQIEQLEKSN